MISISYELEYGATDMHIHKDVLDRHKKVIMIPDLIATGGTMISDLELIENFQGKEIV